MTQLVIDLEVFKELRVNHEAMFNGSASSLTHLSVNFKDTVNFNSIIVNTAYLTGGYSANDPAQTMLNIVKIGEDKYTVSAPHGSSVLVKPFDHEKYLAFSSVKTPFRKTTGSAQKVIAAINKWQEKRLAVVIQYYNEISPVLSTTNLAYLEPKKEVA